jgi:hypothetical protein
MKNEKQQINYEYCMFCDQQVKKGKACKDSNEAIFCLKRVFSVGTALLITLALGLILSYEIFFN